MIYGWAHAPGVQVEDEGRDWDGNTVRREIGRGGGEKSGGWGAETGGEEDSETKLVTEGE